MNITKPTHRPSRDDLQRRLAKAQEFIRAWVPPNVSLVDELIAERRDEARRELDDERDGIL